MRTRIAAALLGAAALQSAGSAAAESLPARLALSRAPAAAPVAHTRDYETPDLLRARRLAIAALQDLGFALESADSATGTITASRLDAHPLRVAVVVAESGEGAVRTSVTIDYAGAATADPRPAEAFFAAYEAALTPPPELDF